MDGGNGAALERIFIERLHRVMSDIAAAGFVLSGELAFIRPRTPGLVRNEVEAKVGPVNQLTVRTVVARAASAVATSAEGRKVFHGELCVKCGSPNLRQTGACKTCTDCGESQGCG